MLRFLTLISLLALAPSASFAQENPIQKPKIVTSFSILADITQRIGGDNIELTNLVPADADAHDYEPTPKDIIAISKADLVIINGLNFESWMGKLITSSAYTGQVVVASKDITPILTENTNETDPHAWQSVTNVMSYANTITAALIEADPKHTTQYRNNANSYLKELQELDAYIKATIAAIPKPQRTIVSNHDAFQYYARYYDVQFIAPSGLSPESSPSAADIANIITLMRKKNIHTVFIENISDDKLAKQLQQDAKATLGGTLYSDALSPETGPATTYITLMKYNTAQLTTAMKQNTPNP